jgi:hypothetical protein
MTAAAYPFEGNPRTFRAVAMPNGDARFGVDGSMVFLCEQRRPASGSAAVGCDGGVDRPKYLSLAEAEQLHAELGAALRAFDLAKSFAAGVVTEVAYADRPRPYLGPWPIRGPSLAEVDALAHGEAA